MTQSTLHLFPPSGGIMRRTRRLLPLVALVTLPALVVPAAAVATSAPPQTTGAAAVVKVGGWTRLSDRGVISLSEPHALPLGSGGTQVIWYQQDGASSESIRTRIVKETGKLGSPISTVVKGWAAIVDDPKIIDYGNQRMVVVAGLRSSNPGEKFYGPMAYATSGNGATWTLGSGSLTADIYAYASYGTAAVDDGGTPLVGVVAGSDDVVTLHRGTDPSVPAGSPDWETTPLSGNSLYVSLGRDSKAGNTWAVWMQAFGSTAQNGIIAQKVYPKPIGAWQKAPQSTDKQGDFLGPDQGVAVASRVGGEVWAAYKLGYPTANKIALWRVGSKEVHVIKAPDVDRIALLPGPGGRLWLAWYSGTSGAVKVTRTNPAVTRFGKVSSVKPPTKKGSYSNVWSIGGSGRGGPLHLVVNAQIGAADPQIWYRKVLPGLLLVMSPHKLADGKVVAKVTDAGAPVAKAKVTFLGTTKTTGANGTVTFTVGKSVRDGRYAATAAKAGYARGRGVVTVT